MTTPSNPDLIVDVAELQTYMSGVSLSTAQLVAAEYVIAGLTDSLERIMNRALLRKARTETLFGGASGIAYPSATPVISATWTSPGGTVYPLMISEGGIYVGVGTTLEVTYVGGYDGRNDEGLRLAVMRAASREMTARHDDTLSVKDLSVRDEGEPTIRRDVGWQPDELMRLMRLRRRVVA